MMHQRDRLVAETQRSGGLGKHAERKPVDHDDPSVRHGREPRPRCVKACRARAGEFIAEIENVRMPAQAAELGDHAPVVGVTSGRRVEVAWNRKDKASAHHTGASYHARADGDSAIVTRIAAISRPSRPSLPARTCSAIWSNTCRVRNSVVVLRSLKSGNSSRLR